jgi:rhamnogalacturonyl hydrolase YesR
MKLKSSPTIGIIFLGLLAVGIAQVQPVMSPRVKYFGHFSELSVGAIQPRGWIQKWLERQALGLTGHPENLDYPYDTCMYAGLIPLPAVKGKYWKEWWPYEQSAYFVDATVRLSHLINDPAISARRDANINFILDHSSGTNLGGSHACWPNAVVGRALMAEYSATGNQRVEAVLQNWLLTSADEIAKGGRAGVNFEEAFYLYGQTGNKRLLDLCRKIYEGYLHDTNSFCTVEKIQGKNLFHEHGVTAAEELKCLPLMFSYTGDEEALRLAKRAYEKVLDNNLMADGGIVSSEHLEPTSFYSVHESCDITDWSWSLGYLFMATGETRLADLVERTTFNALPGAVTKDFKQLQYFSSVNQTLIAATNSHTGHWLTRMNYRAAHDTECCAGNINRAMPNYVMRMWMQAGNDSLAAVYYGPCVVKSRLGENTITITEETDYPFRDEIQFRINTSVPADFDLQLRIPEWCDDASIRVNEKTFLQPAKAGGFVSVRREFRDGDIVSLMLPMRVRFEPWFKNQSVSVSRGPLVYSLKIAEQRIEHTSDPDDIKPFLDGHEIRGFPEVEFSPASDWRYGVDTAMVTNLQAVKIFEDRLGENPFSKPPLELELQLRKLPGWLTNSQGEPVGLPALGKDSESGSVETKTLIPYGSTHLRLTTLPLIVLGSSK